MSVSSSSAKRSAPPPLPPHESNARNAIVGHPAHISIPQESRGSALSSIGPDTADMPILSLT